jgi:hypothetical protein
MHISVKKRDNKRKKVLGALICKNYNEHQGKRRNQMIKTGQIKLSGQCKTEKIPNKARNFVHAVVSYRKYMCKKLHV